MEVGPLAEVLVAYAAGEPLTVKYTNEVLAAVGAAGKPEVLFSALGRVAARVIHARANMEYALKWSDELIANIKAGNTATANVDKWEPSTWPKEAKGVGFTEAPRGALGHWVRIKDGKIDNYQCVVPTTWNGSPRDHKGQIGAFEASLMNTPLAKADQPLEILRTIHSFDPCLACSTHVMSPDGQELTTVTVR